MKEITVETLKEMQDGKEDFQLIDVREPHELDIADIGGEPIPMGTIPQHVGQIAKDKKVVIMCRSGKRSGQVVQYLEQNHGFDNLYNLAGGILDYADKIDPSLEKY